MATVLASQVLTVLPTGSFAAEATGQEVTNPALPSADAAASKIAIEPMSLALDNGVTEKSIEVSTFADFKTAVESKNFNVIKITGNFQFTSDVAVDSNMRIEGNGHAVTAGSYQMVMRSTSTIDVEDLSITNVGSKGVFRGYNAAAAPTVNLTNNVQVFGMIMGGLGKLSLSIAGTNNRIVSPDKYGMEVDELTIADGTRIEELSALDTAVKVRSSGAVGIGDNAYINMNSSKGYAFDVSNSALVIGENTVLKSASKFGTVSAATLVVKNGADLTFASGDKGNGIYVSGNITIGDDVKLKATGTGTAVYAYNTGAAIVVGKNADIDIVSDSAYGIYGNASITFGDGSALKLRTQKIGIYSVGSAAIRFGSITNQPKAAADRVNIDIDSADSQGIYSTGGQILFGDDTEVNVKAKYDAIYTSGNSRVNFGSNTKTTISSSSTKGINAGGVVIGDDSTMDINAYVDGIYTADTSGEGLTTGKNVNLNITASTHDGIYTYKNTNFGENNTVAIKAFASHAIHSLYGSSINIGANSNFDLSGTDGVRQEATSASALNVGTNSTLKIAAESYGIYTSGSVTFANGSKANIRAASKTSSPAIKANGVVTFQKDSMAYVESLYPSTTTSVFDLSGAANSKLVLNSPKFIDFRQNNNDATKKTGHIVKGYTTATVASQSRIELNNVTNLMAWNHGSDWSKAANSSWTNIDSGRVNLSSKNGTATTTYYGGVPTGIEGFSMFSLFDYTRLSTEGSSSIARPAVNPIYTNSKTVTGTGVAGNEIIVTFPNGTTGKTTVKQDGTWSLDVPAGVTLTKDQSVVSYQTNGVNNSPNITSKVIEDLRVPVAPTVKPIKEGDTTLTGNGEPNKDITVTLPDGSKVTGKTDANGDFSIPIPAQKENAVIKVTQKGDNGLESPEKSVIVASNQKPVITAGDQTFRVGETFSPLAGVTATDKEDGSLTSSVKVKSSNVDMTKVGNYTVVYTATDKDGNTTDKSITIKVIAATAGTITANDFTIGTDNYVSGDWTGDVAQFALEIDGKVVGNKINITKPGTYQYYAKGVITDPTKPTYIIAYDKDGKVLQRTKVNVIATTKGTITAVDFTVGKDNYVSGNWTGDVAQFALEIDGKVVGNKINITKPGTYQYYAKGVITDPSKPTYIIAYDAAGKVLQRTEVNVISATVGTITADTFYLGTDGYVKGGFTGDVAKVSVTIGNTELKTINITDPTTYKYYVGGQIKDLTDTVVVTAYDASGKKLASQNVTIAKDNGKAGEVFANTFKLGKDSSVIGNFTGDIVKVELQVAGQPGQRIDITTPNQIKYYAKNLIKNNTDEVTLIGYNSAGFPISTKVVKVITTEGTISANPFVIGTDLRVTGKVTGDVAKISMTVNNDPKSTIPATGDYLYYAANLIKNVSDTVIMTAYDATGEVLDTVQVTVSQAAPVVTVGTVTPSSYKVGTDSRVTGTFTGDVAKVQVKVKDGAVERVGKSINATANINYYAGDLIKNVGDVATIYAYDKDGKLLDSKTITLSGAVGTVTANAVTSTDRTLTGSATGDVTKVTISINGAPSRASLAVVSQPAGTYSYYAQGLLQAGDTVKVIGLDSQSREVTSTTITVN
ncbi:immunoglobulin-like domain-containing protein [Listeria cornellensis]|uniref:immunoglobulin-like domain-containing protein n=1 Tax=Listeria cornellensis TaxID=1494961 RepID=UPI00131F0F3A|nr:immunoglobulin-like domain-containing protein [Listeria cornellensis]